MTDDEIIKALDCCNNGNCDEDCPFFFDRGNCYNLDDYVIDLINRQKAEIETNSAELKQYSHNQKKLMQEVDRQKAEIESLKDSIQYGNEICENCQGDKEKGLKKARTNAIKEFAEMLKEKKRFAYAHLGKTHYTVYEEDIDNLVQEMVDQQRKEDEGNEHI